MGEPLGFFDPLGFCSGLTEKPATEGKVRFYREVELKHCRVAMLAALGYPLAEQFHPLFGGDIDTPSFTAFQATPLETWWGIAVFAVAIPEIFSVFTFNDFSEEPWSIRSDHKTGDLAYLGTFDPLGLKPEDPAELKEMQTKEQALLRHPSASKACTERHGVSRARSRSMAWRRWLLGIRIIHERGTVAMTSLPLRIAASTQPLLLQCLQKVAFPFLVGGRPPVE